MAGKKILVADDSLTIQKVIRLALSGDGYEIQTVSDGREALEQASLFRPDICIVDVSLPKYDAYEIRERFLQAPDLKNIPVILMSSAFEKIDEARMRSLGFSGHLVKPFDPSHLRSTLLSVSDSAPENDPILQTINTPAEFDPDLEVEVMGMDDFAPIAPPPPSNDFQGGTDEIQRLARNTFEMSGLNQHDWGMIEPGKAPEETAFQAPPFQASAFQTPVYEEPVFQAPTPPPAPKAQVPAQTPAPAPSIHPAEIEAMIKMEVARVLEEMHFQIQDRIQHELKEITKEVIPNIAERIIKEEIHRLLSNPPV